MDSCSHLGHLPFLPVLAVDSSERSGERREHKKNEMSTTPQTHRSNEGLSEKLQALRRQGGATDPSRWQPRSPRWRLWLLRRCERHKQKASVAWKLLITNKHRRGGNHESDVRGVNVFNHAKPPGLARPLVRLPACRIRSRQAVGLFNETGEVMRAPNQNIWKPLEDADRRETGN